MARPLLDHDRLGRRLLLVCRLRRFLYGWTQVQQYEEEVALAEALRRLSEVRSHRPGSARTRRLGAGRLFVNNCAACHGSDERYQTSSMKNGTGAARARADSRHDLGRPHGRDAAFAARARQAPSNCRSSPVAAATRP
jgi:mono/diheme cytochrome c family protein